MDQRSCNESVMKCFKKSWLLIDMKTYYSLWKSHMIIDCVIMCAQTTAIFKVNPLSANPAYKRFTGTVLNPHILSITGAVSTKPIVLIQLDQLTLATAPFNSGYSIHYAFV